LIVDRLPVTWAELQNKQYIPDRGQVIVFKNPQFTAGNPDEYIVKRVIAFPGERVVLNDGKYTVYNAAHPMVLILTMQTTANQVVLPMAMLMLWYLLAHFSSVVTIAGNYSYDSRNALGIFRFMMLLDLLVFGSTHSRRFEAFNLHREVL